MTRHDGETSNVRDQAAANPVSREQAEWLLRQAEYAGSLLDQAQGALDNLIDRIKQLEADNDAE